VLRIVLQIIPCFFFFGLFLFLQVVDRHRPADSRKIDGRLSRTEQDICFLVADITSYFVVFVYLDHQKQNQDA
jgi:hypothetical protein